MQRYLQLLRLRVEDRRETLTGALAELRFECRWPDKWHAIELELRLCDELLEEGWDAISGLTALRLSQWLDETHRLAIEAEHRFDMLTTQMRPRLPQFAPPI